MKLCITQLELEFRGYITNDNVIRLKSFMKNTTINVKYSEIEANLCILVLIASFVVYHSKFEDTSQFKRNHKKLPKYKFKM